jgi:hypothetical protein
MSAGGKRDNRFRISDRRNLHESDISDQHLGGFSAAESRGQRFVDAICQNHSVTRDSLVSLAHVFSCISGVRFPRDFARRRVLVIKWFDDHIDELESLGKVISLEIMKL